MSSQNRKTPQEKGNTSKMFIPSTIESNTGNWRKDYRKTYKDDTMVKGAGSGGKLQRNRTQWRWVERGWRSNIKGKKDMSMSISNFKDLMQGEVWNNTLCLEVCSLSLKKNEREQEKIKRKKGRKGRRERGKKRKLEKICGVKVV